MMLNGFSDVFVNRTLQLQPNSGIWEKWASLQIGSTRMKKLADVFLTCFFNGSFNGLNLHHTIGFLFKNGF